jgi:hypothetical protein
MVTAANALVVMAKAPLPGESKTRLVPPLTFEEAAALSRALLLDQLDHLAEIDIAPLFVSFAPESSRPLFEELGAKRFSCFAQRGDGLGERMREAFRYLFARGFKNVVLIGSDLPPVPRENFDRAFVALGAGRDVVLGPAEDGGYYLVGMNRFIAGMFEGIGWSRADVLARTLKKIDHAALSYELLPVWHDVDTPEDLLRLYSGYQTGAPLMKNTSTLLQELRRRGRL